jgi:hypothetical protein
LAATRPREAELPAQAYMVELDRMRHLSAQVRNF